MSILEKEVWINVVGANVKHYENKEYKIPRYISKQGKLKFKNGTKILVKVEDLPKSSGVKLTKICDICGIEVPNQGYETIITQRGGGDGKDRCRKCGQNYGANNRKNNVKYENSLEFWANENDKEYLLVEWSSKNQKSPSEISRGDNDKYWWICPKCKSEYDMISNARLSGGNCPYCANRRVNETNCLWTTNPDIAKLLFNPEDGKKYVKSSHKKLDWKCPNCGEKIKNKQISTVTKYGVPLCQSCSDGISYPEKLIINILGSIRSEI